MLIDTLSRKSSMFLRFPHVGTTVFLITLTGLYLIQLVSQGTALSFSVIELEQIHLKSGHAFEVKLSPNEFPIPQGFAPILYEHLKAKGGPIIYAKPVIGETRVYYFLSNLLDKRFPDLSAGIWTKLGPEVQTVAEVRSKGEGRYGIADGGLVFSASDNSSPITNGRAYQLRVSRVVPPYLTIPLQVLCFVAALFFLIQVLSKLPRVWTTLYTRSCLFRNLAPGIVVSAISIIVFFVAGEIYLRATIPFTESNNVFTVDPNIGNSYKPGAELRATNHVDFWTVSTINSLGFVDREPMLPKDDDTFRIVIIGDSYVEAVQVDMQDKFSVLLETRLRQRFPDRPIDVVAMGIAGTGQVNQLAYLETYAELLRPVLWLWYLSAMISLITLRYSK